MRGPGDAFGELALLEREPVRSATVSALEPAETHSVYRGDFERLRREHPIVNDVLIHILADRLRHLSEQVVEAYYVPADRRVVRRVCELAELYGHGETEIVVPLTQEEIAELAGTSARRSIVCCAMPSAGAPSSCGEGGRRCSISRHSLAEAADAGRT